jgi:CRISPR-associated protein Cmr2
MKNEKIFSRKLSAFLHDPIDKPFILMQGESHEERAKMLAELMQVSLEREEGPDWIASAMERVLLPKGSSTKEEMQVKFLQHPEIKHPLSGIDLICDEIGAFPLAKIKELVDTTASDLSGQDGDETKFLTLWRNYLELLKKNSPAQMRKYWSIIPADTRIPDHSIFEHLKITSACFNSMADRENDILRHNLAFFMCTIGPVQSFIATARKLQDLWMGSFILSYLIWSGIKMVVQKYGPDAIIFPDLHKQPLVDHWLKIEKGITPIGFNETDIMVPTFPNRFLAIVPNDNVGELGKEVESQIKQSFKSKGIEAVYQLKMKSNPKLLEFNIDTQLLEKQLSHFLNVYWIAMPWPQSLNGRPDWRIALDSYSNYFTQEDIAHFEKRLQFFFTYGEYPPNIGSIYELLHSFTERAIGARKNIRNFEQSAEEGQKCSLCGERRAFISESTQIRKYQKGLMGEKEYLCGVCMTKRLGKYAFTDIFKEDVGIEFPSIAEVAVSNIKFTLLQSKPDEFKKYVNDCRNLFGNVAHKTNLLPFVERQTGYKDNIGGEFLIEDFLSERNLKQALDIDSRDELPNNLKTDLTSLREKLKKLLFKSGRPSPYYAVIRLDGDNMGKWLKGDFAPNIDKVFHSRVWENFPDKYKKELKEVCRGGKRPMSPAIHGAISTALRDYSLILVKRIVENDHLGKLIYAGGDDVLALVNLKDLLSVMVKLRAAFSGHIDSNLEVDFTSKVNGYVEMGEDLIMTMGPDATASMGIVIAHYKMPFSLVLDKAIKMEKKAKQMDGKNAFAIALMKHSGELREGLAKWCYEDISEPGGTVTILKKLANWIRNDWISNKFIYVFRDEFLRLTDTTGLLNVNTEILKIEIPRLLKRATKKKDENFQKEVASFANDLYILFQTLDGRLDSFLTLLETSNFLAGEV